MAEINRGRPALVKLRQDSNASILSSQSEELFPLMVNDGGPLKKNFTVVGIERMDSNVEEPAIQKVIVEMYNLTTGEEDGEKQWVETARWEKYEENITRNLHIGQPHLPFLSFHALVQLRGCLAKGVLLLDLKADSFLIACRLIAAEMARKSKRNPEIYTELLSTLYQYKRQVPKIRKRKRSLSLTSLQGKKLSTSAEPTPGLVKRKSFFFTIEEESYLSGYETAQVFASTMDQLDKAKFAMIRLASTVKSTDITAPPIRFIFLVLGPENPNLDYSEIGRCIGTLMSNPGFQEIAYSAADRKELIYSVDRFLDGSLVLPPGDIKNKEMVDSERIQKELTKRQEKYFRPRTRTDESHGEQTTVAPPTGRDPLKPTGRLFGGLIDDFKEFWPFYKSDFTEALHFQTITSIVFMFVASFAPAIIFGGILGSYTNDTMGTIETLLSQCICGLICALFSAQPLLVILATGPVMIFEASLYALCTQLGLDFLLVRLWTGVWVLLMTVLTVMFDGSVFIKLVTRFTDEIFATLISLIFIVESFGFLKRTFKTNPIEDLLYYWYNWEICMNETNKFAVDSELAAHVTYWESKRHTVHYFAMLEKEELLCFHKQQPDTALLTTMLLGGTFILTYLFKQLRTSRFLGRTLRQAIGDFRLLICILIVAFIDYVLVDRVYLEHLDNLKTVELILTKKRYYGFLLSWLFPSDQWWGYIFTIGTAFLFFSLFFVETGIAELLLINKNLGLRKGSGFHWDLLLTGLLTLLCSMLGLPWMCASESHSLGLYQSLTVMKSAAPGEKPSLDFVREQRVTMVVVSIMLGFCAFGGQFLVYVPLASLFGVILFFGVMEIVEMAFTNRLILILVPQKHFPRTTFTEKFLCVVFVYMVKHFKATALAFPLVQLLTCLMRSKVLPLIFTEDELEALDGPEDTLPEDDFYDLITIPL